MILLWAQGALTWSGEEALDNGRSLERRERQDKEELVKLRRRADDLVRKAYFRYAGEDAFRKKIVFKYPISHRDAP